MSILNLQRSIAEAGRIRIGQQVPTSGGRTRPEKLSTFRLTSADKRRIEEAAGLFGGEVTPWAAPAGPQWQVVTTTAEVHVIVPPRAMAFSQHYELWTAGGCSRRCDGEMEILSDSPCLCDPDQRECDIHTRLSLMIRDLPGLALWRLDTQGWHAARELAGAVEVLALAAGRGVLLPARLLLEQRSVKRQDASGKPQTLRFAVPRLDLGITPGELLLSGGPVGVPVAALTDGAPPERRLTPVPAVEGSRLSIAEQSAPPPEHPGRRNAATEIPSSGRRRAAKGEGEAGYWQARAFAEASERGLGTGAVREIAAGVAGEPIEGFSMSALSEAQWERVCRLIPGFAPVVEVEGEIEGAAVEVPPVAEQPAAVAGLSDGAFTALARQEMRTKGQIAIAIGAIGKPVPVPMEVRPAVTAMTDEERGRLADELKLDWRSAT